MLKPSLTVLTRSQTAEEGGIKENAAASFSHWQCICYVSPKSLPVDGPDAGEQLHDGPHVFLVVHLLGRSDAAGDRGDACPCLLLFAHISPRPGSC